MTNRPGRSHNPFCEASASRGCRRAWSDAWLYRKIFVHAVSSFVDRENLKKNQL